MSDEIQVCKICSSVFPSLLSLKIHIGKKHKSNNSRFLCCECDREFTRQYHLDRHVETCKKAKDRKIETKITEIVQEQIIKQQPQQITYITNTNNNITNNNGNNINNYGTRNYTNTQNNYLTNNDFDNLVPITNRRLQESFQSVFNEMKQTNQMLKSEKDLGFKLTSGPLKDSLVCTDASRGIVHWKDGDNDNQHVKDSGCIMLSDKMFNALSNKKEMFDDYKNYLYDKRARCDENMAMESIMCSNSEVFIRNLNTKDNFAKVGKSISKTVPCVVSKKEYNLENLYKLMETMVYERPYEVLLQSSEAFAMWFIKVLNRYEKFKMKDDDTLELYGEQEEVISVSKQDIFLVLKQGFGRIEESAMNAVTRCILEVGMFSIVKPYIESKEIAIENFEMLKKWLNEDLDGEATQKFEGLFIRFFNMNRHTLAK